MRRPPAAAVGWLLVAVTVATGCALWSPLFSSAAFAAGPLLGTVGASCLVALVAVRRWARWSAVAATTGAALCAAVVVYRLDLPAAAADLAGGWKRLATAGLYLPTTRDNVIVPTAVATACALAAQDLLLRSRHPAAALGPLLGSHLVASSYTAGLAPPPPIAVVPLAVAAIGLPLLAQRLGPEENRRRAPIRPAQRLRTAAVVVGFVTAVSGLSLGLDPSGTPFTWRDRLTPGLRVLVADSPLALVKEGLVSPAPGVALTVTVTGLEAEDTIDRLPVAYLDRYDGSIWYSSVRYQVAGQRLPRPSQAPPTPAVGRTVEVGVELGHDYPFATLPTAGTPTTVDQRGLVWDPVSGLLAVPDGWSGGPVTTTVELPSPRPTDFGPAEFGPPPPAADATSLPPLDPDIEALLTSFLDRRVDRSARPADQLSQLTAALTSDSFAYNPEAPAGHSLALLARYLDPDRRDGSVGIGFAEQSAAAFALLARMLGLPSRVAVGYLLPTPLTASQAGPVTVTGDRIHAWPEVWSADQGWVGFEPTSTANPTTARAARIQSLGGGGDNPVESAATPAFEAAELIDDPLELEPPARSRLPLVAALVALLLLLVLSGPTRRFLRHRRRRRGDPTRRVVGAWHHTRDVLVGLGLASPAGTASARELADDLQRRGHDDGLVDAVDALADALDTALYHPRDPAPELVDDAWVAAATATGAARRAAPRTVRARAALTPRAVAAPRTNPSDPGRTRP